jgi:rod shape determining protein RodA
MSLRSRYGDRDRMSLAQKLGQVNWLLVFLLCLVAAVGFAMLYSAAGGNLAPWASRQMLRFALGLALLLAIALVDVRFWLRWAYLIYAAALGLLGFVEVAGDIGKGAQRWIDLGLIQLQPSEVMKIALVLALARYFHWVPIEDIGRLRTWIVPLAMVGLPVALVMRQPDLGTALLLAMVAAAMYFLAGLRWWKQALAFVVVVAAVPIGWRFLHDYQKDRVLTFLDPERDPLGAGYHITQSKIALGSGGLFGKGYMQGTQSHLSFLPERQTDFIFTMLAEEMGMVGGVALLALYLLIVVYGLAIALRARHQFGRLLAMGLATNFFLYVFINMAMVMGLIPVVGVPLPLVSYGGTAMLTLMIGFGMLIGVFVHRDVPIGRRGLSDD